MKNIIKNGLIISACIALSILLCGCSTLDYVGEDYVPDNKETVKTNEDFIFSTYKKSLSNANVKMGITKTPVPEILALYVKIENLSYESPYIFKVDDLILKNPDTFIKFITSNNYLSIWQNQEAASMSAMGNMSATISNMTGINSNYQDYNQAIIQNTSQESNKSAFNYLDVNGSKILKHSITTSATISPRKSQYFYFFFENTEKFPITVKYKTLTYQFNL